MVHDSWFSDFKLGKSDWMIYKIVVVKRWKESGPKHKEQLERGSQKFQIQESILVKKQ